MALVVFRGLSCKLVHLGSFERHRVRRWPGDSFVYKGRQARTYYAGQSVKGTDG